MSGLKSLYRPSLALLTDLYQLTMAYGYWKAGVSDREAVFHLFFRENPFGGGLAIACGLAAAVEYVEQLRFDEEDMAYLASLRGNDGGALFEPEFLLCLRQMEFTCDVDGVPEGTVVFPHEPLIRTKGPIVQCQLLETPLLNLVNFPTLIATKAARVVMAAGDGPVLEFGLRRAQGIDGGLTASRAAYIGGCAATSNVLAGRLYGIPVKGTHAHSWVMCFDDEPEAFEAYARAMPNNCVFLVDTYDTLEGVRNAVKVGRRLRERGHEMVGIRLDSGDLVQLSVEARRILDEAGFTGAAIIASNDLDEHIITGLKNQGAEIGVWGVGTRLVTAHDQPALGGVYKLSAVREGGGPWRHKVKLSGQAAKVTNPGILQTRRYLDSGEPVADMIYDTENPPRGDCVMIDPVNPAHRREIKAGTEYEDLLVPVFRAGKREYDPPPLEEARERARRELASFPDGVRRLVNPDQHPVGLERGLHERKLDIMSGRRGRMQAEL